MITYPKLEFFHNRLFIKTKDNQDIILNSIKVYGLEKDGRYKNYYLDGSNVNFNIISEEDGGYTIVPHERKAAYSCSYKIAVKDVKTSNDRLYVDLDKLDNDIILYRAVYDKDPYLFMNDHTFYKLSECVSIYENALRSKEGCVKAKYNGYKIYIDQDIEDREVELR